MTHTNLTNLTNLTERVEGGHADLCIQFHKEIVEEAKKHKVPIGEASMAFFHAYELHKVEHGSFNPQISPHLQEHYTQKMHERYRFMRQTALDFISKYRNFSEEERQKFYEEASRSHISHHHHDKQAEHARRKL